MGSWSCVRISQIRQTDLGRHVEGLTLRYFSYILLLPSRLLEDSRGEKTHMRLSFDIARLEMAAITTEVVFTFGEA